MAKKRIQVMELTAVGFQVFLGASATALEVSPGWVAAVTGGAVRSTLLALPTAAVCPATMTSYSATTSLRRKGYLSVV